MNLVLIPIFGISGVGIGKEDHFYINIKTQICISERAFPYQDDHKFVKFDSKDKPLMLGMLEARPLTGTLRQIIYDQNGRLGTGIVEKDGFGNKLHTLTAGELKSLGFSAQKFGTERIFEETFSIQYLESLPDEIPIIILLHQ
jgi:hypothetical protein